MANLCHYCHLPLDQEQKLVQQLTWKLIETDDGVHPTCEVCYQLIANIARDLYWIKVELEERELDRQWKQQIKRLKSGGDYFGQ